jgi:hypothetical protein
VSPDMVIRLRDEVRGNRVHSRVYIGPDGEHLQLAGSLVLDVGEWQLLGAALLLGAAETWGRLAVEYPDDLAVLESLRGGEAS